MNHTRFPKEDHLPDWARRDNEVAKGDCVEKDGLYRGLLDINKKVIKRNVLILFFNDTLLHTCWLFDDKGIVCFWHLLTAGHN